MCSAQLTNVLGFTALPVLAELLYWLQSPCWKPEWNVTMQSFWFEGEFLKTFKWNFEQKTPFSNECFEAIILKKKNCSFQDAQNLFVNKQSFG